MPCGKKMKVNAHLGVHVYTFYSSMLKQEYSQYYVFLAELHTENIVHYSVKHFSLTQQETMEDGVVFHMRLPVVNESYCCV